MKLSPKICGIAAVAALSTSTLPISALADSLPSYAANDGETIHGRISSVSGKYDVYVRDDRGYIDHIVLHDGTVIHPTGLELATGETVAVTGRNSGRVFLADEVDTPYSSNEQPSDNDGPGDGSQGFPFGSVNYGNPYGYGYGYPGYGGLYIGGYYGGGYAGRGYSGHGSDRREPSRSAERSYGRGGTFSHSGSSGGSRGGSGHH